MVEYMQSSASVRFQSPLLEDLLPRDSRMDMEVNSRICSIFC